MSRGWEKLSAADVAKMGRQAPSVPQEKRSKYGATPTTVDGIRFHSAKESRRYAELKLLEQAGQIARLKLQQRFELCVPHTDLRGNDRADGRWTTIGHYIADFTYDALSLKATEFTVEDVKGFKTPQYRWKKKHFESQYGIQIREV